MCSAYIHTDQNDQYLGKSGDHNCHLPVPETIELSIFKEKVKERIVKETVAIGKIYDNELASATLSEAALALASLPNEAKSSLNRLRRQKTPPLPKSSIFNVPDAYSIITNGASFLFSDILKHPNVWAFINLLKDEEVHFQQLLIYTNSGKLKKDSQKTCVMQNKLNQLRKRYGDGIIQLSEYHYQLSLLVGMKSQ
ncbi:unnamed protein product [Rotaria sp. Silwood2]|nr:unnamed protein product [Rotaria sp. Silwood2]